MKAAHVTAIEQHLAQRNKLEKQAGVTILQILIGTVVGAIALAASINAINGQRADSEQAETVQFISTELTPALAAIYYNTGRSYGTAGNGVQAGGCTVAAVSTTVNAKSTAASCAANLVSTRGLRDTLPTGEPWNITANTTTTVSVGIGCALAAGGNAVAKCNTLLNGITGQGNKMITNAVLAPTAAAPTSVTVTVGIPS